MLTRLGSNAWVNNLNDVGRMNWIFLDSQIGLCCKIAYPVVGRKRGGSFPDGSSLQGENVCQWDNSIWVASLYLSTSFQPRAYKHWLEVAWKYQKTWHKMTIRKYLLIRWMSKVGTEIIFLIYFHHPKEISVFIFFLIFCLLLRPSL